MTTNRTLFLESLAASVPDAGGVIRCLPHVHGTDGFTAVRLMRRPRS